MARTEGRLPYPNRREDVRVEVIDSRHFRDVLNLAADALGELHSSNDSEHAMRHSLAAHWSLAPIDDATGI